MTHDLVRRIEKLGSPRVVVIGDLILDRYIWGYAERISQEAPVPLLRADHREHRLGGAASVATMVRTLGAQVRLVGGVGCDSEASLVRSMLAENEIDDQWVVTLRDRPTTLKERYIGRAQDRHPQQMIRVDYETRDPIRAIDEAGLHALLPAALEWADAVLVSDYGKGVCTPTLLRAVIDTARQVGVKVLVDPIRSSDYDRYRGVQCITPNRLEAQLATGMTITCPDDALSVGKRLVESLALEAVLITLDRDGMALVRSDGQVELVPTRARHVYDITGAGDMVLAVVGLCIADGADYDEAAALGNVAGGLEVEKFGVALLTRAELLSDLVDHDHVRESKNLDREELVALVHRRRLAGQKVVFTNGCFDLLRPGHVRLLRLAAEMGDCLVVGVNSDASARRLKGPSRPINPAEARAEVISALEAVDCVTVFDEETPRELITAIRPDILVKGGDYQPEQVVGRAEVEAAGGRVVLIPLAEGHSTTTIVRRARDREVTPHAAEIALSPHVNRISPAPTLPAAMGIETHGD
jgi:D-beta-D-heptose 7-phosphate kinase / D-beta-D-heptose 1-phosphate adenosyltransferase